MFEFILAVLATYQVVEVWRHGEIFSSWRAYLENFPESFFARLLGCPWCLSVWVGGFFGAIAVAEMLLLDYGFAWSRVLILPSFGFSVSRAANMLNDITHGYCRTPRGVKFHSQEPSSDASTDSR